jgi:hypothetical protein
MAALSDLKYRLVAQLGARVVACDGDLRQPQPDVSLRQRLGGRADAGLVGG